MFILEYMSWDSDELPALKHYSWQNVLTSRRQFTFNVRFVLRARQIGA